MKAALIHRYGSNDAVRVADVDVPTVGATDVLVRLHAASVNPVDIKTHAPNDVIGGKPLEMQARHVRRDALGLVLTTDDLRELDEAFPPPREPQPLETT